MAVKITNRFFAFLCAYAMQTKKAHLPGSEEGFSRRARKSAAANFIMGTIIGALIAAVKGKCNNKRFLLHYGFSEGKNEPGDCLGSSILSEKEGDGYMPA